MEIVGEDTYDLPLYESIFDALDPVNPDDPTRPDPTGRLTEGWLTIRETEYDTGQITLAVVHQDEREVWGRYRFRVTDYPRRICRYAGEGTPPWTVNYAVATYGYYPETASSTGRKYAYDLLYAGGMELVVQDQKIEFEYLSGWTRRLFDDLWRYLHLAVIEYQVGPERMDEVSAWLQARDEDWSRDTFELLLALFREFDVGNAYLPTSPRHPSQQSLMEMGSSTDVQAEADELKWHLTVQGGREANDDEFYVVTVGESSIDRFPFQITDEAAGTCIAQTELVEDLPPYSVIERVSEDYEITNIPSFGGDEDTYRESVLAVDSLVRRITSLVPPQSARTEEALDSYLSTLSVLLVVLSAYEMAPEAYDSGIRQAFDHIDIELSRGNVAGLPESSVDQISTVAFQAVEDERRINEVARDLLKATRITERRGLETQSLEDLDESQVSLLKQLADPDSGRSIYD